MRSGVEAPEANEGVEGVGRAREFEDVEERGELGRGLGSRWMGMGIWAGRRWWCCVWRSWCLLRVGRQVREGGGREDVGAPEETFACAEVVGGWVWCFC